MKKFLSVFILVFLAATSWGQQKTDAYDTLRAGTRQVQRLHSPQGREFLLSNLIYPKQKKQISVLGYVNIPFRNFVTEDPQYPVQNPGYQAALQALFDYIPQAWQAWRQAANAWLPKAYQLPQVQFTLTDGYKSDLARQPRIRPNAVTLVLEAISGKVGLAGNSRANGIALFTPAGSGIGRIQFLVEQEWMNWFNEPNDSPNKAALAQDYQKAAAALLAGEFYDAASNGRAYAREDLLSDTARSYIQTLSQSAPDTWHKQGPWAVYNRYIFTHEMGHLFGLVHADEPQSIMAPVVQGGKPVEHPSAQDGLRLATLVCWYYNQRAGREVCVPLSGRTDTQRIKTALKDSLSGPSAAAR